MFRAAVCWSLWSYGVIGDNLRDHFRFRGFAAVRNDVRCTRLNCCRCLSFLRSDKAGGGKNDLSLLLRLLPCSFYANESRGCK